MHFYTALDWTCQDWTRADLPFSHCALRRKMESTNTGIFVWVFFFFLNGDVESLLHSALEQKWSLLKCCMRVKAEGHPCWLWERRGQGAAQQQPWASFGSGKQPGTQGMEDWYCEKPQGMGEKQMPGACSARSREELNCSPKWVPRGGGDVNLWFAPTFHSRPGIP